MDMRIKLSNVIKSIALLFFLLIGFVQSSKAQFVPERSHPLSLVEPTFYDDPVDGILTIIAVRVEFQPDSNRFTSGNGTFGPGSMPYLENSNVTIDPLPHNRQYFESHLQFSKNYFERMSNGLLNVEYRILDEVYRLPNEMAAYSPIGVDPSSEPLADLAKDTWEAVAESGDLNLNITPGSNVAFAIFHAGVGRDIQLVGTTLDKTPQDIPSVYLSKGAFSRLLNDPTFSGFPIDNGNIIVDNTMILPRTLSRSGEDITGSPVLLQLSTNGLITAQIGSHIGLPDLFNTQTGESGIGRFGLMDGAGIFAFNGLFPPELSAWEKIRLGWEQPFEIEYDQQTAIDLPAATLRPNEGIGKVSISNDEYFLIENRHRDVNNSGVTLTFRQSDGSIHNQTFTNSDTSFVFQQSGFTEDLTAGVLIDVDNLDFALPGGPGEFLSDIIDGESNRQLNGGMLIWHIDESVIRTQLSARAGINDNPDRRGVRLVEADGAQDIGRPTTIGFFENEINGSAFDFWWSGNDASVIIPGDTLTLYENRFGPDTTPDNDSNSGAKSFFELFDFSDNLPTASFRIQRVNPNEDLYRLADSKLDLPFTFFSPSTDSHLNRYPLSIVQLNTQTVLIPSPENLFFYSIDSQEFNESGIAINSIQQPFVDRDNELFTVAENPSQTGDPMNIRLFNWNNGNPILEWDFDAPLNRGFISSPSASILDIDGTRGRANLTTQSFDENFYPENRQQSEPLNGYQSIITSDGLFTFEAPTPSLSTTIQSSESLRKHTGILAHPDQSFSSYLFLDDELIHFDLFDDSENRTLIDRSAGLSWPAFADINNRGKLDFIYIDEERNEVVAKNINGAVLSDFPIPAPQNVLFTGTPLIADINGDGSLELLITGYDASSINIYAYGNDGRSITGFPLIIGGIDTPENVLIHPAFSDNMLFAVSHSGDFKAWEFPNMDQPVWGSKYGNSGNSKVTGRQAGTDFEPTQSGVLNRAETYNWPNPASDETHLRFETSGAGSVQIKITTTSGRLVYDRTIESRGNLPEEILIDTSNWGSGGYMALVTARVNGQTERKLIKIAIAR